MHDWQHKVVECQMGWKTVKVCNSKQKTICLFHRYHHANLRLNSTIKLGFYFSNMAYVPSSCEVLIFFMFSALHECWLIIFWSQGCNQVQIILHLKKIPTAAAERSTIFAHPMGRYNTYTGTKPIFSCMTNEFGNTI